MGTDEVDASIFRESQGNLNKRLTAISEGRSEAQIATEYRERALAAMGPLLDVINEARQRHGMVISFQISAPDGFNRQNLAVLEISKKLC